MKKFMKKSIAFMLAAGLMLSAATVLADDGGSTTPPYYGELNPDTGWEGTGGQIWEGTGDSWHYVGNQEPTSSNTPEGWGFGPGDSWQNGNDYYLWVDGVWELQEPIDCGTESTSGSSSSSKSKSDSRQEESDGPKPLTQQDIADIVSQAETAALQSAASDEGFTDEAEMQRAAAKNMSAGEYYNNAVMSTPGIEAATPVGQGGNLVVDGVVTNMTASISKVSSAYVESVRASIQEGTVLNVVDVQFPALSATINFYMPGVADGAEITAMQYAGGAWVEVEVVEIRADHVVLNLKQNGKVAFVAK